MELQNFNFQYKFYSHFDELNEVDQLVIMKAYEASKLAYAPYSNFRVGAAILSSDGSFTIGYNQENASYPCGICAERNVIHNYGIQLKKNKIGSIAIVVDKLIPEIPFPCGFCRQVMAEAEMVNEAEIRVIVGHPKGKTVILDSVSLLLPFAFNRNLLTV